ncbi:MAG: hypothetical protein AAF318_16100 [Pseudomonadota bacterium]
MGRLSLTLLIAAVCLSGVTLFSLVAARTLERTEAGLAEARFGFVLSRVDSAIERSVALGFPLANLPQADAVLQEARVRAPAIRAADIVSETGVTLFSTDRAALGEPMPVLWQNAIDDMRGDVFRANARGSVSLGRTIENDFGLTRGYAVVIVERGALPAPLSRAANLVPAAAPYALAAAVAGAILAALLLIAAARLRFAELSTRPDPRRPVDRANARALATTDTVNARLETAITRMQELDAAV